MNLISNEFYFQCVLYICKCTSYTLKDAIRVLVRPQPNIKQLCGFLLQTDERNNKTYLT